MTEPNLKDVRSWIIKIADLKDGVYDGEYTQENFTSVLNNMDR